MPLIFKLDLSNLTFGDLYRFADHARSAGIPDDVQVTVEDTDALGNDVGAHALVAELGDVDQLSRPVLIDSRTAYLYAEALGNVLAQREDSGDRDFLDRLHTDLLGLPHES
jgi:hypothetical protein